MENCVTGPYMSAAFSLSNSSVTGTSSNNNNYNFSSILATITAASNYQLSTSAPNLAGLDLSAGYDLGGIRTEINYSYTSGSSTTTNLSGTDTYTVTQARARPPVVTLPIPSNATISSMTYTRQALLANAAFDIPTGTRLIPYFGAGLGVAWLTISGFSTVTNDLCQRASLSCPATASAQGGTAAALAVQAKTGIAYMIDLRTSAFIEAVYDYTGAVAIGNLNLNSFNQYSGKIGIRYRF